MTSTYIHVTMIPGYRVKKKKYYLLLPNVHNYDVHSYMMCIQTANILGCCTLYTYMYTHSHYTTPTSINTHGVYT